MNGNVRDSSSINGNKIEIHDDHGALNHGGNSMHRLVVITDAVELESLRLAQFISHYFPKLTFNR